MSGGSARLPLECGVLSWLRALGAAGATNAAILAFTVVNSVIVARMLGPEGRGALFALLAYPSVVAGLAGAWVQPALSRRAARREMPDRAINTLCVSAALPLAAGSLAISAALLLGAPGLDGLRFVGAVYAAAWTPANFVLLNLMALDLGRARWRRYNGLRLLLYPLNLAGLLGIALAGAGRLGWIVAVYVASNAALLGARLAIAAREGGFAVPGGRGLLAFYREAFPFAGTNATTVLAGQLDQILAAGALDHASAGLYAVAQRAGGVTAPLGEAAAQVAFVEAAGRHAASRAEATRELTALRLTAAAVGALAVALAPAVWLLVPRLYGAPFAGARGPALLMLGASVMLALAQTGEQRLQGVGRPDLAMRSRGAGALVLAVAGPPGAHAFGLRGLVAVTLAAQLFRGVLLCRILARFHQVSPVDVFLVSREDLRAARRLASARLGAGGGAT
jgi:O-antigen/teichoic acid export membrane protein